MNPAIVFRSRLAESMSEFVAFKRMQGYDYSDQARMLSYFDRFLAADGSPAEGGDITPDTLRRYVTTTARLAAYTRETRLSSLREFSRWRQARHPGCAVLPKDILPRHRRRVRFFPLTPAQVAELMTATVPARLADRMRDRSIRTLIGLLYCTGLRISEALKLTPREIAPDGATLHVARGKFGKERLVPVSPSTYRALTGYLAARQHDANGVDTGPLFITAAGAALNSGQVYGAFRRLCRHCGIWGDPPPRLHDLRHNYACRRLALWREAGMDINAMLPVLATAMGHVNFFATQRYLHLDAVALQNAAVRFNHYINSHSESPS